MIKERNGEKYSLKPFEGYKFRAKFVAENNKGEQLQNTDIYTTNIDRNSVEDILVNRVNKMYDGVVTAKIIHWCSKEQDDLIDEMLNDL